MTSNPTTLTRTGEGVYPFALPRDFVGAPTAGFVLDGKPMIFLPVVNRPLIDVYERRKG